MEQTTNEPQITSMTKSRNSFIAFFLSLILPGLGQVYNGQLIKGLIFFLLPLIFSILYGLTRTTTFFYGFLSFFVVMILLRLYTIIDAVNNAKRQKEYILKPYNKWYYYLLIAISMLAIMIPFDLIKILGTQSFKIPTTSNNPTFQVGDWLLADMKAYENKEPDYGDIVVFSRPDGQMHTFRVVGKPNDNIEIINNMVSINGILSKSTFIKDTVGDYLPIEELEEELPNGHKHLMYRYKGANNIPTSNIQDIVVPADSYYLLGDNRDNAFDSRLDGFIKKDRIKGKIIYSYWGETGIKRMNIDFTNK